MFTGSICKRKKKQHCFFVFILKENLNSNAIRSILKKSTGIICNYHYNFHISSVEQKLCTCKCKEGEQLWEYSYSLEDRILMHFSGHNFLLVCLSDVKPGSECLGLLWIVLELGHNLWNACDCFF